MIFDLAFECSLAAVVYPFSYSRVLMQLGHQSQLSSLTRGKQVHTYPNAFYHICHIYRRDGFCGLYRGLGCKLASVTIYTAVINSVEAKLAKTFAQKECDEFDNIGDDVSEVIRETALKTLSLCAGIICSQPFYVIYLRSMAQHVGGETCYSSIFSAISAIWKSEGISGFFAGLVPRLVGETLNTSITTIFELAFIYFVVVYFNKYPGDVFKQCSTLLSEAFATVLTYPFKITSVVMAVSPSRLRAVSVPNMPRCDSWLSCLQHLKFKDQAYRGMLLFL